MAHQTGTINRAKTHSAPQIFTITTAPPFAMPTHLSHPTCVNMNTFDWYLLSSLSHNSANNADEMQFLFSHPQTPLPTEPTYTDLTPSHLESALPTVLSGTSGDMLNPMSMFYASEGVAKVWDNFLQNNAQGRNGCFHAKDYNVVRAVSASCCIPQGQAPGLSPGLELLERTTFQACPG